MKSMPWKKLFLYVLTATTRWCLLMRTTYWTPNHIVNDFLSWVTHKRHPYKQWVFRQHNAQCNNVTPRHIYRRVIQKSTSHLRLQPIRLKGNRHDLVRCDYWRVESKTSLSCNWFKDFLQLVVSMGMDSWEWCCTFYIIDTSWLLDHPSWQRSHTFSWCENMEVCCTLGVWLEYESILRKLSMVTCFLELGSLVMCGECVRYPTMLV